jgi:acyl-CoA reductase-like NAD-dependent aldehyde dehydrogenase
MAHANNANIQSKRRPVALISSCFIGAHFYEASNRDNKETKGTLANRQRDTDRRAAIARFIKALDKWAKLNEISRPEAIRRLAEHSLPN